MLFIAACADKPHSLDVRKENCPAYLSYLKASAGERRSPGPRSAWIVRRPSA